MANKRSRHGVHHSRCGGEKESSKHRIEFQHRSAERTRTSPPNGAHGRSFSRTSAQRVIHGHPQARVRGGRYIMHHLQCGGSSEARAKDRGITHESNVITPTHQALHPPNGALVLENERPCAQRVIHDHPRARQRGSRHIMHDLQCGGSSEGSRNRTRSQRHTADASCISPPQRRACPSAQRVIHSQEQAHQPRSRYIMQRLQYSGPKE